MAEQTQLPPTLLQKIAAMFGGSQAGANVQTAQNPAYIQYVRETKAMGDVPLTIQEWTIKQQPKQ